MSRASEFLNERDHNQIYQKAAANVAASFAYAPNQLHLYITLLEDLTTKYGEPIGIGAYRVVFDAGENVVKMPLDLEGESDNQKEYDIFKRHPMSHYAKCEMVAIHGVKVLMMEKLTQLMRFKTGLQAGVYDQADLDPQWINKLDAGQVGISRDGQVKAYDYSRGVDGYQFESRASTVLAFLQVSSFGRAAKILESQELYHTTSFSVADEIKRTGVFRPGQQGFVSFSEKPWVYDISARDCVIAVDKNALAGQLEQVQYTRSWARQHPDQMSYIAGEGWREQYECPLDPEDFDDDDDYDDACEKDYEEAEIDSFMCKDDEREWISRREGEDVRVPVSAILRVETHR